MVIFIHLVNFSFFSLYSDDLTGDDLIERLKNNPNIVNLLKSPLLVSILKQVIEKRGHQLQSKILFGQENWEQTVLKDYIFKFPEFQKLVKELLEIV